MLLDTGLFPAVMHIAITVVVGFVLWDVNTPAEVIGWCVALSSFVLFQAVLVARCGGQRFRADQAQKLLRLFATAALGVGLSWGFAGWFLFPEGEPGRQIFLTFVMGGMAMSAVSTQHVHILTCLFSVVPGMVPLALRYMTAPVEQHYVFGGLLLVYTLVLIGMMRRQWRFAMMAFRLQMENEELLEEASRQAIELDVARQTAEAANAAKSRFLAQASHDLRQPLHAISLYVEALPVDGKDRTAMRIMGRVRQSLDVLSRLFNSLLDVTLLDTGQIEVRPIVFRPRDLLGQIRNEFSGIAETAHVEIRIHAPDLAVRADPVLLRRMLQNLCSNALRHAEGGAILLAVRRAQGAAVIEVYDTGDGIPKKDQGRVFEEFTRLDPARMGGSAAPGLGLGLAIVQRLAGVLGLMVTITSEEDRGTRFRIAGLPVARLEDAVPLQEEHSSDGKDVLAGLRVLFIDDDQETLDAGTALLARWGCHVEPRLDWTGALEAMPDIVICDYELSPGFTGFDALDDLYDKAGRKIPTVMISGNSSPDLRAKAKDAGLPLINKPVRPGQLRSALLHVATASGNTA